MRDKLKAALSERQKRHITDISCLPAAVLVPIFIEDGDYHILFTKRTEKVRTHKGQISFPGGVCEAEDGTPVKTALRECAEEVGLGIESVEVLGELDDEVTVSSGFIISPFVAFISSPYEVRIAPSEVEETIGIPVSALLDKDCFHEEIRTIGGQVTTVCSYNYQGRVIWGATARILNRFLEIFTRVTEETKMLSELGRLTQNE